VTKITNLTFPIVFTLTLAFTVHAQVKVTVDYNASGTPEFKFKNVPAPAKDDAASKAKSVLVVGELDPNGAGFSALTDGLLPTSEDQPAANLFFNAGGSGGRTGAPESPRGASGARGGWERAPLRARASLHRLRCGRPIFRPPNGVDNAASCDSSPGRRAPRGGSGTRG